MTMPGNPVASHAAGAGAPSAPVNPSSANAATAGAVASANAPSEGMGMNTKIHSLAELKKKSPKVYNKMMEGIAMNICGEMREHQDRLKKLMREGNQR